MQRLRRFAFALAVPTVAVGAIAFTAHSALSAPTAQVARTEPPPNQPVQPGFTGQVPGNPNNKQFTLYTRFTLYTLYTNRTKLTVSPSGTAPPTTTAKPTTTAPSTSATPSRSGSATAAPSGSGGGGAVVPGAPISNCAGKQVQAPLTVKVGTVRNVPAIVDGDGCTLYVFAKDNPQTSACDATCEGTWPPAIGPGTAGEGVQQQNLGTFARTTGFTQVTYFGKQLYYFSGDKAPGDANGQGVGQSWYTVDPNGNPITQ